MGDRERALHEVEGELERLKGAQDGDPSRLRDLVRDHLIDVAGALSDFADSDKLRVFEALTPEDQAEFLQEVDEIQQNFLLDRLEEQGSRAEVLGEMALDDAADIVDQRSEDDRERILEGLDEDRAAQIRELARFDPDTAGGLMTPEFVAVEPETSVAGVKELIRSRDDFESINNIFVVTHQKLVGVFSARELILAENDELVSDLMTRDVIHVDVDADREECFRVMETYHLFSMPVVDTNHDLLGIITVDDVLTAVEEEASEDVFRMAGSADLHPTQDTIGGRVRKRIPFLLFSVFGGLGSAFILKAVARDEEAVLNDVAYFLPMIPMIGGNIAMQSSAVMVRGFATGEIEQDRIPRVIRDELAVGMIVSLPCGLLGALVAFILGEGSPLRMCLAVMSSILTLAVASSLLGTGIPSVCQKLKVDPAISAGPFITGLIDMIGCLIYILFIIAYQAHGTGG